MFTKCSKIKLHFFNTIIVYYMGGFLAPEKKKGGNGFMTEKKFTDEEIRNIVDRYGSLIFRISYCILCNRDDAEDAVQETLLKYMTKAPEFRNEEHRKAWLIKVAANISKNMFKLRVRHSTLELEEVKSIGIPEDDFGVFESLMGLPKRQKIVLTLHYSEGYKCKEIAEILGISEDAVKKRLQKGRELLKKELERTK